jgi:predicted ATPase
MLIDAHYSLGMVLVMRGELTPAQAHADEGSALGEDPAHAVAQVEALGVNLGPICRATAAWSLWAQGYPDQARKKADDALAKAGEQRHPFTLAHVLFQSVLTCQYLREVSATRDKADAAIALALEHGFPQWVAWVTTLRGWALAELGQREEGIAEMRQGLAAASAIRTVGHRPYYLALLAEACGKAGRADEGLRFVDEALALAEESEQLFWAAELHRLRGELLLSPCLDEPTEAETCFRRAFDIARDQGANSWELRAATSLARLWAAQGKRQKAHDLLAPIYGWFTEGFDTADLKEAKSLLDELT